MSVDLYRNVGEMTYDGLITDIIPAPIVRGGTIAALGAEATLKRGTIMAKNSAGKLIVLGSDVDTSGTWAGTGDGTTTQFSLVAGGVAPKALTEVKVGGTATTAYTYNADLGVINFTTAPANAAAIAIKFSVGGGGANCILAEDVTVGTAADAVASVYIAGCFDPAKCIVATDYTISAENYDDLRKYGILFKKPQAAN